MPKAKNDLWLRSDHFARDEGAKLLRRDSAGPPDGTRKGARRLVANLRGEFFDGSGRLRHDSAPQSHEQQLLAQVSEFPAGDGEDCILDGPGAYMKCSGEFFKGQAGTLQQTVKNTLVKQPRIVGHGAPVLRRNWDRAACNVG